MIEDIKYWLEISQYDLDTAKAMLDARKYLYVLFTCQQSIEKLLKAFVIKATKEFPPKTHNLIKLADIAGMTFSAEEKDFLEKLGYYYIETRYPETKAKMAEGLNKETATNFYAKTKELWNKLQKTIN
jgi:HEPN domain-containing protein